VDGDMDAVAVIEDAARYLGIAIAGMVNALNPEMVLIGGGMSKAGGAFIAAVREQVRKCALRESFRKLKIARAVLGEDAGIVGAAGIALSGVEAGSPSAGRFRRGY
jgi:glucokinase